MKLYLTRHGETDWNRENRVLGRTDIPLNQTGLQQAETAARYLADRPVSLIYTSPLSRAVMTGRIIAAGQDAKCVCEVRGCLIEQDFGIFEGVDRGNADYQREKRLFFKKYENGESYLDVAARVYPFLDYLATECQNRGDVLIVTHGGICRIITNYFKGMDNEEFATFSMKNCEVREFEL